MACISSLAFTSSYITTNPPSSLLQYHLYNFTSPVLPPTTSNISPITALRPQMVPSKSKSMASTTTSDDPDEFAENPSPLIHRSPAPPPHPSLPIMFRPRWSQPNKRFSFNFASNAISSVIQSILPTCHFPTFPVPTSSSSSSSSRRRRLTGTLFGPRKGRVTFAIQSDPRSPPGILLELAFQTAHLVQEMASGAVRILLECEKKHHIEKKHHAGSAGGGGGCALWEEPVWTMYCNGRRTGFAVSRKWGDCDKHVFGTVGTVSAGAGVLPPMSPCPAGMKTVEKTEISPGIEGLYGGDESMEMMFMRAKFERVVGGKDSEAFYMMSPDGGGGGGPELSVFLLRL